jgi:hypothetical protein
MYCNKIRSSLNLGEMEAADDRVDRKMLA